VINEAALLAARRGLRAIGMPELEEARDKVRWGRERRSMALSQKEKENTAYHEAGHALLLELLEHTEPLHKVPIIPRGPSLGSTMWLPEEDKYTLRRPRRARPKPIPAAVHRSCRKRDLPCRVHKNLR